MICRYFDQATHECILADPSTEFFDANFVPIQATEGFCPDEHNTLCTEYKPGEN